MLVSGAMKNPPFLLSFLLLVPTCFAQVVDAMEIVVDRSQMDDGSSSADWTLQGDIEKGDFDKLISAIQKYGKIPASVALDSEGGDINEAINLGLFFRKALIGYRGVEDADGNPVSSECSSACALIYFGATRKLTHQKSLTSIGLHRPYFDHAYLASLTQAQASDQYRRAENTIRQYLQEMAVPDAVADVMFETEASSMSYFNDHELSEWLAAKSDHHQWLNTSCDELSANERIDLRVSKIESSLFASDYVAGLNDKYAMHLGCRQRLIAKTHQSILRELGCTVTEDRTSCYNIMHAW